MFVAAAAAMLVLAGLAYAVWSSTQTGPGAFRVGQPGQYVVSAGPAPGAPGGPPSAEMIQGPGGSGSLSVQVQNTSNVAMTVTAWQGVTGSVSLSGSPSCAATDFTLDTASHALSTALPASQTVLLDLPSAVSLNATAPTGCAGVNGQANVTITVTQGA